MSIFQVETLRLAPPACRRAASETAHYAVTVPKFEPGSASVSHRDGVLTSPTSHGSHAALSESS